MGKVQSNTVAQKPIEPREQITQMLSPEDERSFEESLPESTAQVVSEEKLPRRKRRTKEEMAAARGETTGATPVVDKRLEKAKARFASLGAGSGVKSAFKTFGKPLNDEELEEVDDYFYLVGSKGALDPTQSWITMFFCAVILFGRLIAQRTELGDDLKSFLFPDKKEEKKKEEVEEDSVETD